MSYFDDVSRALRLNLQAMELRGQWVPCAYPLAEIVAEICDRAGLPYDRYDVSQLRGGVVGFMHTSDHPAFTALRALSEVYYFDPVSHSGKLHFVPRGGETVAAIDRDDLTADSDDEVKRGDGVMPRVMHLSYYDLEGQQEPSIQSSDRSIYLREDSEARISTPVVLTSNDAAQTVSIGHKVSIEEQRGRIKFELPDRYLFLTVGDCVELDGNRLRIWEDQIDEGFQRYKASRDLRAAYDSRTPGARPPPAPEFSTAPGDTRAHLLDLPALEYGDGLGYRLAISGDSPAWPGARVALSTDGGETYTDAETITARGVIGELLDPLPAGPRHVPDRHHRTRVRIRTPGAVIEPATLREQLNRANRALIGHEIVAIGDAEEVEAGVWEIAHLLRGRLHTGTHAHPAGTRFVLLDGSTQWAAAEPWMLGYDLHLRATTVGTTNQTDTSEEYTGRSQIEPPPGYLRTRRTGGDLHIQWIGTGTRGARTSVEHSAYWTGYRVTVGEDIHDTTDTELTVPDPGSGVTVSVSQVNSITGPGLTTEIET